MHNIYTVRIKTHDHARDMYGNGTSHWRAILSHHEGGAPIALSSKKRRGQVGYGGVHQEALYQVYKYIQKHHGILQGDYILDPMFHAHLASPKLPRFSQDNIVVSNIHNDTDTIYLLVGYSDELRLFKHSEEYRVRVAMGRERCILHRRLEHDSAVRHYRTLIAPGNGDVYTSAAVDAQALAAELMEQYEGVETWGGEQ